MADATDHGSRDHAKWSASASARNFNCPGAIALIESLGLEDREGEAAAWGTACHQIAEECLRSGASAVDHLGRTVTTKSHSFDFDDEQAECTQVYLDYVRGRLSEYAEITGKFGVLLVEQKFTLAPLNPPFEAGGTGDAVLLLPAWGLIETVDLKTGRSYVEADDNKQLRTYSLCALMANPGKWREVRSTIVQPRVGRQAVRSETLSVADLADWTTTLVEAMRASGDALRGWKTLTPEAWSTLWLKPGPHCASTYCPAAKVCPALARAALKQAQTFFEPVTQAIAPPPDPRSLTVEQVAAVLDAADMIEGWLNAVRAYGREIVESGGTVGDYILVAKEARRKWKDEAKAEEALALLLDPDKRYVTKLVSPTQAEKALGAKRKAEIADLWSSKSSGTNLVRADKTTREAVAPPALQFFTTEA